MLWTAFLMGFIGSLHCIGMCGPLTLLLPTDKKNYPLFFTGRLLYNFGRISTYAALGIIIGLIGQQSSFFISKQWLSILLGVSILLTVLLPNKIINLYPNISRFTSKLKRAFKSTLSANYYSGQLAFGFINGLLPCGLVYAALAGSFIQLSAFKGAAYMALFGLGTLPMMLGISLGSGWFKRHFASQIKHIIPLTYGLLALWLIYRGVFTDNPDFHGSHVKYIKSCFGL